jgi:ferritin-like metal-binding protein YciE
MKFSSLNDLYLEQLKDLHSAETQLTNIWRKQKNSWRAWMRLVKSWASHSPGTRALR